ncbi:hypothetical protein [Brevibacillus dissolubilis]|uniref:hypothetical protein n=1 Tax=Brevibacillus dissolubilis TaxID=1844116 RepID=UPI0011173F70|nr:hypothetical protein [Brevibacillus dissolubilis]
MADHPREADVQVNRIRQLNEPYPAAARVIDEIVAEKAKQRPAVQPHRSVDGIDASLLVNLETEAGGLKTGVPSNYETNVGGATKSMTDFEVKKSPGRL